MAIVLPMKQTQPKKKVEIFRLPAQLSRDMASEAARRGMTKTKFVEWALLAYLSTKQPARKPAA